MQHSCFTNMLPAYYVNSDSIMDRALLETFVVLEENCTKIWNTVEIMELYEQKGGTSLPKRTLLEKIESFW